MESMVVLLQTALAIPPKGKPLKPSYSNSHVYQYSKRTSFRCCRIDNVNRSANRINTISIPERSPVNNGGGSSILEQLPKNNTPSSVQGQEGIGIVPFFQGKNIFVTGATGFLAKVLIEKLLRTVPDVDKSMEAAAKRLKNEIINAEIFKLLQQFHRKSYESFMLGKLVPVAGDLSEPNLGFDDNLEAMMAEM